MNLQRALTAASRVAAFRRPHRGFPANPGLIGAEIASWAAFSPSLMPRSMVPTAVVTFTAQVAGHVVGTAVGYGFRRLDRRLRATSLVRFAPPPRVERNIAVSWHSSIAATTIAVWARSISQQREIGSLVGLDGTSSAKAQLTGTLAATSAYLTTQGLTFAADWVYDNLRMSIRPWLPPGFAPVISGVVLGTTVALAVDKLLIRRIVAKVARNAHNLNMRLLPGRQQPWEPQRSGSPWSLEPWHALGAQGRAVVADGPRARDIAAVTKRDRSEVMEPIRIYAGHVRGRSLAAQTELIIREMHRTGAFRRDHLVVYTTTGTGWTPEWSLVTVEFLTLGNCAQIGLQYSDLPSPYAWLADHDTAPLAGRALINRVYREWQKLPEDDRPKFYVAGESLGAFGGTSAFFDVEDMLSKIDGAVWSGAPRFTPMWQEITKNRDPGSPEIAPIIDGGRHIRFATRPRELYESVSGAPLGQWLHPRVVFLQHASDPIVWWDYSLAWRRPDWLREPLGRDVLPTMRWFPFVTFWQVLIDGLVSTETPGGIGHRYEEEMLPAWASVLGLPMKEKLKSANGIKFKRIRKWIKRNHAPRF
ncbi:alpha/beta-hydrolase family protein [Corynebacterium sp. H78]|uniref:alpha/beta-hydrolase family protein n=1 Tax=Corynebacterium sp. H78 TaxID=3133417 RepID=UPI0030A7CD40